MKRYLYLFPLMAFTAATLTLAACDDKKAEEEQAVAEQTVTTETTEAAPEAVVAVVNVEGATSYATAEGATTGAVFLTLHNPQTTTERLLGAKTDKAPTVELHESYVDETTGTMQMRRVDGVDVPAGQQVSLKPDGFHIMLMGLATPLVQGETFNITLQFQNAPEVTVPVTITAAGDAASVTEPATATDATAATTPSTEAPAVEEEVTPAPTEAPVETPAETTTAPAETTTDAPVANEQPAQ